MIRIGLCSTDGLYFASGRLGPARGDVHRQSQPGAVQRHQAVPSGAAPVGEDTGLAEIREAVRQGPIADTDGPAGTIRDRDMLADYARFLRSLVDLSTIRPLRVVVDAGNGMGGFTVPAVLGTQAGLPELPLTISPMYFELDGTFPNHEANPIDPANLVDLSARVVQLGADLGLAFDGDADRCFVVDERGEPVSPSAITALIAAGPGTGTGRHHHPQPDHQSRRSRDHRRERGYQSGPGRSSYIKASMARTGAAFGGEHSGHFYFRDFWRADSGMLAAMNVLSVFGATPVGTSLSDVMAKYERYHATGEINSGWPTSPGHWRPCVTPSPTGVRWTNWTG